MTMRAVAIRLKIPDNEAYTALTALRRLHVPVNRVERADIWVLDDAGDDGDFVARIEANEALFNPNKHQARALDENRPREGEAWIEMAQADNSVADDIRLLGRPPSGIQSGRHFVGWRLFSDDGTPAARNVVNEAVEKLLCNPAIERARIR